MLLRDSAIFRLGTKIQNLVNDLWHLNHVIKKNLAEIFFPGMIINNVHYRSLVFWLHHPVGSSNSNSKYVYCQYIEIQQIYNCQHCVPYTLQPNRYEMEMGHVARQLIPEPPPRPGVMAPTPRPRDHATQPRIGRPKMKLRTTEPQMSRSGPTQSRSTRIAVPAPAAKTTRPRCPIFPQTPQRLTYVLKA